MIKNKNRLIFVYNAESGLRHSIMDMAHKALKPETYQCNLCALTHGPVLENKKWKKFRKSSGLTMEFLHKNQFVNKYVGDVGSAYSYPVIIGVKNNLMETFVHTEILNVIDTVDELIALVNEKSAKFFAD